MYFYVAYDESINQCTCITIDIETNNSKNLPAIQHAGKDDNNGRGFDLK